MNGGTTTAADLAGRVAGAVGGGTTAPAGLAGPSRRLAEAGPSRRRLVVVGSGIAGLYAALLAAEAGAPVTLLSKGTLEQSNTHYAQGGICAVLDMLAAGQLPQRGFVRQEDIALDTFLANRFGRVYGQAAPQPYSAAA